VHIPVTTNGDRILTTHTGSLPRPKDLVALLYARDRREPFDEAVMAMRTREAVAELVARQRSVGLDVVNDGEAGKLLYSTYVQDRLSGYTGSTTREIGVPLELRDFPDLLAKLIREHEGLMPRIAVCEGPISYQGQEALRADVENLQDAVQALDGQDGPPAEVFVSAASPGIIATYLPNRYYATDHEYVWAIAEAMKTEYDAIHEAGFTLQLDCPDLAFEYTKALAAGRGLDDFRAMVADRVAALNHATQDIPSENMRMHICWGNGATPHHYDVPLHDIVDLILEARPAGLSFEGANPRHAHEWKVWETTPLPEGKYLIPGVIDSTTNFIEHPELVAERVLRFASVVGPGCVMAGVDCGLATAAGSTLVDRDVAWAKLGSLVEGTRLANEQLKQQRVA
jgi:5-methyltetrahydropteroyltriglutamate--homocysteine methyltransferase